MSSASWYRSLSAVKGVNCSDVTTGGSADEFQMMTSWAVIVRLRPFSSNVKLVVSASSMILPTLLRPFRLPVQFHFDLAETAWQREDAVPRLRGHCPHRRALLPYRCGSATSGATGSLTNSDDLTLIFQTFGFDLGEGPPIAFEYGF